MLACTGFKTSNDKLQLVQSRVHYLGNIISLGLKAISAERVQLIKAMRTPESVTQLQRFLGLVNYCRAWIPDCAYHDKGLRCLIQHGMGPRDSLNWTSEAEEQFDALKIAITCAPALRLPDYSRPFPGRFLKHVIVLYRSYSNLLRYSPRGRLYIRLICVQKGTVREVIKALQQQFDCKTT